MWQIIADGNLFLEYRYIALQNPVSKSCFFSGCRGSGERAIAQNHFCKTNLRGLFWQLFAWSTAGVGAYCCDRKSRAACAQSFAPRQQATIEIMRRNLSYHCLLALHIYLVLHAHLVRGESHNERSATGEVATVPYLFERRRVFWRNSFIAAFD